MRPVSPVSIVVLSKYQEILDPFIECTDKYLPIETPRILVVDGELSVSKSKAKWKVIPGHNPFSMGGNGNLGWKAVSEDSDILYLGDDVRIIEPDTIDRLQSIAYKDPGIGILSPRLLGRASKALADPKKEIEYVKPLEMWFPCVYIKREIIEKVGYLDERFNDFGSDDLDYCIRVELAGYKLGVTSFVTVLHEASSEGGPTTFVKKLGVEEYLKQQEQAYQKLKQKYDVDQSAFERALRTGDSNLLIKHSLSSLEGKKKEPSKEEARKILESRSIFLATPCYGGQMSVNYANSLLSLSNLCRDLGIRFTVSFVYNESLIARARNKLVWEFLNKSNFTDFFFVDADISFDARDLVSLCLHDEGIVGAPCVRKNLRLDRIVEATKKNGKDYTLEELHRMIGEFVVNFAPGQVPPSMNLGQMLEVQDVGTGFMRIRRETFHIIKEAFPDRWYLPMGGEGDEVSPHYMFFQSCIDEDSAKYNVGGYPHYIPEDFSFCRLAKKAGVQTYLAPWIKTDHAGFFIFRGDLETVAKTGGRLR